MPGSAVRPPRRARHSGPTRRRHARRRCRARARGRRRRMPARASHSERVDCRCQPCVAMQGVPAASRRTSKARAMRSRPKSSSHSRTAAGSDSAALPIDRSRGARLEHALDVGCACAGRPPTCSSKLRFAGELRDERAVALVGAAVASAVEIDDMQPIRPHRAVLARKLRAAPSGTPSARAKSPRNRRTQRPSFKSMAGNQTHGGRRSDIGDSMKADEIAQHARAGGGGALRVKLHAIEIAPGDAGAECRAVAAAARRCVAPGGTA